MGDAEAECKRASDDHLPRLFCRWPAVAIHGDKSQQERDWVLKGKVTVN